MHPKNVLWSGKREKRSNGLGSFKRKTRDETNQEIVTGIRTLCNKGVTDKEIATKMKKAFEKFERCEL